MRKEIKKQLQTIMDQAVKDNQIAGMNMMVIKDGQEEAYLQCGYADKANGKMIERDTIFRLFSMTKPITAAAAMILFERGVIDLADPVSRYIPGFADQMVSVPGGLAPVWHNVTVYHLLSMTSGLTYGGNSSAAEFAVGNVMEEIHARLNTEHPMTTLEFADKIGRCPLEFQPGERWKYGVSADILAAVVEKASGMKYGEFLKKELFVPLGMKDTDFYVPGEKLDRLAMTYEQTAGEMKEFRDNSLGIRLSMDVPPAYEAGGAGLVSTIEDYSRFAAMLINKGSFQGRQILKPASVEYMTTHKLISCQQAWFEKWWEMNGYSYGNLMRVLCIFVYAVPHGTHGSIQITVDGELYGTYSLAEDQVIQIGDTNVCEIKDGEVKMTEADCPDHLCMKQPAVGSAGGYIVCLPNRVVIQGEGDSDSQDSESGFDAVV